MALDAFFGAICGVGVDEAIKGIGYICKYEELVESVETDLKSLDARLSTIKKEAKYYEEEQHRVIREDVNVWMNNVKDVKSAVKTFLETTRESATGCCVLDCNWKRRYTDGKDAKDQSANIVELTKRGIWKTSGEVYTSDMNPEPMAKYWESGYVALTSMEETIEKLKGFLQAGGIDDKFVVGIHGDEGVGKTTLAMKFAADMESAELKVVFANGMYDDEKIRAQIAERVGFQLTPTTSAEKAGSLFNKLSRTNVLIIFDNADRKIDLREIGVPKPASDNTCRILLVSKTSEPCEDMLSQKNLMIKKLTQDESKSFAAGLAKRYNWSDYSLADILPEKEGLPAEIERRLIRKSTTPVNDTP